MNTGLILVTKPGLVPARQYLELALTKFPTTLGHALRFADPEPELVVSAAAGKEMPDVEMISRLIEENKDVQQVLWFGNSPQPLSGESEQPFDLINDGEKDERKVVAFIEGEYFTNTNAGSAHSEEYHTVADVMRPWMRKTYTKMCGGDLDRFEAELLDPDTEKMINQMSANRGVVVLFSITGKVFKYEKGNTEMFGDFPWGWVSNKLGYNEAASPVADPPKTTRSLLGRNKGPAVPIAPVTPVVVNQTPADPPKTETATKAKNPMIKPSPDLVKTKDYKRIFGWYKQNGVETAVAALTRKQILEGVEVEANDDWVAKSAGKKHLAPDELKEHFTKKIEESKGEHYRPFAPTISVKMKDLINQLLNSDDVKAITSAGKVLNTDMKEPPEVARWSEQMGRDIMEVLRWDPRVFDRFLRKCEVEKDFTPAIMLFMSLIWEMEKLIVGDTKTETKGEFDHAPPADTNDKNPPADPPTAPVTQTSTVNKARSLLGRMRPQAA